METETPRPVYIRPSGGRPSLESLHGWESQYERTLRWKDRVRKDKSLDTYLAFFLNCYALRDWLVAASIFEPAALDLSIQDDFALSLCRDICNRSKHLVLNRPSVDANFFICMEYNIVTREPDMVVCAGGRVLEIGELTTACIESWRRILAEKNLL